LGFVASTCQSQVQVISLCHQHCNVAEEWPSLWFCSTVTRITFVCHVLLGWRL
jgi:hypothetical protein